MRCASLLFLLLASCGAPPVPATRIVTMTPEVPVAMLSCAASPDVPEAASQAVVAQYIVSLWQAGQDCRSRLKAIRTVLAK